MFGIDSLFCFEQVSFGHK